MRLDFLQRDMANCHSLETKRPGADAQFTMSRSRRGKAAAGEGDEAGAKGSSGQLLDNRMGAQGAGATLLNSSANGRHSAANGSSQLSFNDVIQPALHDISQLVASANQLRTISANQLRMARDQLHVFWIIDQLRCAAFGSGLPAS